MGAVADLRADWTQSVEELSVAGSTRSLRLAVAAQDLGRELARVKRLQLGTGLAEQTAARCIRELARDIEDLNARIKALDFEIAALLEGTRQPAR